MAAEVQTTPGADVLRAAIYRYAKTAEHERSFSQFELHLERALSDLRKARQQLEALEAQLTSNSERTAWSAFIHQPDSAGASGTIQSHVASMTSQIAQAHAYAMSVVF